VARRELEILVKVRDQITRPLQSIARRFTRFTSGIASGFARATRSLFSMRSALVALGGVTAGIGISKRFTDAASSVETFRTQLRALIPDARQADAALAGIREFAASTPLETEEVVQAFVRLRAVGVPAAQEVTRALGGVALVFNRDLRDVASAFVSFETEPLRNLGVELRRTAPATLRRWSRATFELRPTTPLKQSGRASSTSGKSVSRTRCNSARRHSAARSQRSVV
jgi:hypothetical protein